MPKAPLKTTELHTGFFWDCDECGKENFIRALVPSLPRDVVECVKELYNVDKEDDGVFFYFPESVKCKYCESHYRATIG